MVGVEALSTEEVVGETDPAAGRHPVLAQRGHRQQRVVAAATGDVPLVRTGLGQRLGEAGLIAREQSQRDARVAYLRLTAEGERRLMQSFTGLQAERENLRDAIAHLPETG